MTAELTVFLVAALPISELRGAIPLGLTVYNLSVITTFFWALLGNILPVIILLYLLEPFVNFTMRHNQFIYKCCNFVFERTRKKHYKRFEVLGALALISFVAIPLPFTGAWTGALAAFVFGISPPKAIFYIFIGLLISGLVVTGLMLGIINGFTFFL